MSEPSEKRTEVKKIRFTPSGLRRLTDAYHEWAKGRTNVDAEWDTFILSCIGRPEPMHSLAGAPAPSHFLDGGREDPEWRRRPGATR